MVCTDIDEMIVPGTPHQNYSEMLQAADAVATRANAIVHSYIFRNTYFFLDFGATETEPWYLLSQRSLSCYTVLFLLRKLSDSFEESKQEKDQRQCYLAIHLLTKNGNRRYAKLKEMAHCR